MGTCYSADNRLCEIRTQEQQTASLQKISADIGKNDPRAESVLPVVQNIYLGHKANVVDALNAGFDANTEVDLGLPMKMPILDMAIWACRSTIAIVLINSGANVDGTSMSTPIVDAADSGMDSVVAALVNHHALLQKPDVDGATALREAVAQGHYSTVKLLLEAGADANDSGHPGESLIGKGGGDENAKKIAALLAQYGAKRSAL